MWCQSQRRKLPDGLTDHFVRLKCIILNIINLIALNNFKNIDRYPGNYIFWSSTEIRR